LSGDAGLSVAIPAAAFLADVDVVVSSLIRPDPPGTVRLESRIAYAQQQVPMWDEASLDEIPLFTQTDDARVWMIAGTPYDIRVVDAATGRAFPGFPAAIDLGMLYSLNDFPLGASEFELALGQWDENQQRWVRLPVYRDGASRSVRATLDMPGVIALMTLAPMSFVTNEETHLFPATGYAVLPATYNLLTFAGGAPRAGYPITGETDAGGGVTSQFFQRARVDTVTSTGEVRLGAIGSAFLSLLGASFPGDPDEGDSFDHRYFPQTGHYISFSFLEYYDAIDGPASLGLPISPQLQDGSGKVVQYFTLGRLEWEQSLARVEIGNLGEDLLRLIQARLAQGLDVSL
jgi:hypothetical protein